MIASLVARESVNLTGSVRYDPDIDHKGLKSY